MPIRRQAIILANDDLAYCLICMTPPQCVIHSHRPGKVMEFDPWLEKSLNFMLTWKNGIFPGKVIENQWIQSHWKKSCAMLNLFELENNDDCMIKSISLSSHLRPNWWNHAWDFLSRATGYIVAGSCTNCYIVSAQPSQAAYAGKVLKIKVSCLWLSLMGSLWCRTLQSYREKDQINIR